MNFGDQTDLSDIHSERLVIVGGGGLAREVLELVAAANIDGAHWDVVGIVDDAPQRRGQEVGAALVLGGTEVIPDLPDDVQVLLCTGSTRDYGSRRRLVERLDLPARRYATLTHPAAVLAGSTVVGHGSVILAGVVATADVTIGRHVVVMPAVILTHDVVIEDYVTIAAGARFAGTVQVQAGAYIASGALIREGVTIGAGALVGMGAVVLHDVPAGEVWVGAPARPIRRNS